MPELKATGSQRPFDLLGRQRIKGNQQGNRQNGRQDGQGPIFFRNVYLAAGCIGLASVCLTPAAHAALPEITGGPELSSDTGYSLIEWQSDQEVTLRIAGADGVSRDLYRGSENAYFLSGLADGDYTLTLESVDGENSKPVALSIRHQSLSQALWLTLIGALIALSTVVVIVRGARDDRA